MSTEETPSAPPPKSVEVPATPQGWSAGAWAEYYENRQHLAAQRAMSASLADQVKAAEAKAAEATRAVADAKAATESVKARAAVDLALVRAGITDAEDMAEFRDRYARVEAGVDGKLTADAWITALKAAPPKWAKLYLDPTPAKVEATEDDPSEVVETPPVKVAAPAPAPPARDPNGGARPPATTPRRFDDKTVARMTSAEVRTNIGGVARDAMADGLVTMSPELQKRLGITV
jgi:hypothetical protein